MMSDAAGMANLNTLCELLHVFAEGLREDASRMGNGRYSERLAKSIRGRADAIDMMLDGFSRGPLGAEAWCHRCGSPNVSSWFVASPLWNAAEIEAETPSGIVCPACFVAAFEAKVVEIPNAHGYCAWELKPEPATMRNLPEELRAAEVEWREAYDESRLSDYHRELEARAAEVEWREAYDESRNRRPGSEPVEA